MANTIQLVLEVDDKGSAKIKNFSTTLTSEVQKMNGRVRESAGAVAQVEARCTALNGIVQKLISGFAAWKLGGLVQESAMLSARVETLGVVMEQVGKNSLYSAAEMNKYAQGVKDMGITTQEARQTVTQMVQAHLDLSKSAQLARVAQDAAVIANTNSSESLRGLMHGITTLQPEILRTYGIIVNFESEYAKFAASVGRAVDSLSGQEKQQIALNAVLQAGAGIAGSYEAAMGTVGKQITSLPRLIEEAKLQFGEMLKPALTELVKEFSYQLKELGAYLKEMSESGRLQEWGRDLAGSVRSVISGTKELLSILKPIAGPAAEALIFAVIAEKALKAAESLEVMNAAAKRNLAILAGYAAYKGAEAFTLWATGTYGVEKETEALREQLRRQKKLLADAVREKEEKEEAANEKHQAGLRAAVEKQNAIEAEAQRRHNEALKRQTSLDQEALKKWESLKDSIGLSGAAKEESRLAREYAAFQRVVNDKTALERWYAAEKASLARSAALKAAEEDKKALSSRLSEAQKFYGSLQAMIQKNIEDQKRGIEELNALYKQINSVQASGASLIRGLKEAGMTPQEKYESQKSALSQQYMAAMRESGQEQVRMLEEFKQAAAAFGQTWSAGVMKTTNNMLFGEQTSVVVAGKEVIASVVADIETAVNAQKRALTALADEKQREIEANKTWGNTLVQTARDWAAEIDRLKGTIGALDAQIRAMEKTITITGEDEVTQVVDSIARNLAALREKAKDPIVITTIQRAIYPGSAPGGSANILPSQIGPRPLDLEAGWSPTPYALGTGYVPKTGLYQLHQGEAVVPAVEVVRQAEKQIERNYERTNNLTTIQRMISENRLTYAADTGLRRNEAPAPLASYASGTEYVPKTGLYQLHQGEAVVPAVEVVRRAEKQVLRGAAGRVERDTDEGDIYRGGPTQPAYIPPAITINAVVSSSPQAAPSARQGDIKYGDIIINIPESAAPQRPEDWRAITRDYIVPELRKING